MVWVHVPVLFTGEEGEETEKGGVEVKVRLETGVVVGVRNIILTVECLLGSLGERFKVVKLVFLFSKKICKLSH